ncbi:MAG: hypothetical protein V1894_05560 [Chloroflexota bacterium]
MAQGKVNQVSPAEAETQEELLLGVIPSVYRRKGFRKGYFDIVVTTKRMIFVLTPEEGDKTPALPSEKLVGKTTEAILSLNKRNFVVDKDEVKSITFVPGNCYVDCCRKTIETEGELEIVTRESKYSLNVPLRRTTIVNKILGKSWLLPLSLIKIKTAS